MVYTDSQLQEMKTEFLVLLRSTNRPGMEELINWMETSSDFFTAPASANYHGSFPGGLLSHSLNVYHAAVELKVVAEKIGLPEKNVQNIPEDSLVISTLLHDLCKANFYRPIVKTWKDESLPSPECWKKYQSYEIVDNFPLGHGEKSVIMLQNFIKLTGEEICAIRWHMGMTDPGAFLSPYEKPSLMKSINDIPIVDIVMHADHFASFMMEREVNQKIENAY